MSLLPNDQSLPGQVHLETLRLRNSKKSGDLIVRSVSFIDARFLSPNLTLLRFRFMNMDSKAATTEINLQELIGTGLQATEMTINLAYSAEREKKRTVYKSMDKPSQSLQAIDDGDLDLLRVVLKPMDIRTFLVSSRSQKTALGDGSKETFGGDKSKQTEGENDATTDCLTDRNEAMKATSEKLKYLDQIRKHQAERFEPPPFFLIDSFLP